MSEMRRVTIEHLRTHPVARRIEEESLKERIMDELREKVRLEICKYDGDASQPGDVADRILAIPEIAEALANQACACGAEATVHECMSCSAMSNSDL